MNGRGGVQPGVFPGPEGDPGPAWPLLRLRVARMDPTPENPDLPVVRQEEDMWILRVETNGKVQEYRCHTELQARALAILLLPVGGDPTPDPGSAPS